MEKVYIVYQVWSEQFLDHLAERDSRNKTVEGVFINEDKAIDYICNRMEKDYNLITKAFRGDNTARAWLGDRDMIRSSKGQRAWDRTRRHSDDCDITVSYEYTSYIVE